LSFYAAVALDAIDECVHTRHIIGHFGDESFQAIDCGGTTRPNDNQIVQTNKQTNKHTKITPRQKETDHN